MVELVRECINRHMEKLETTYGTEFVNKYRRGLSDCKGLVVGIVLGIIVNLCVWAVFGNEKYHTSMNCILLLVVILLSVIFYYTVFVLIYEHIVIKYLNVMDSEKRIKKEE